MNGWVFPVRLFHSRVPAGSRRRTVRSVNPIFSSAGSPTMMGRRVFPSWRIDHGEAPAAGGGLGGADRLVASEPAQPAGLLLAPGPQPGHDAELGLQARAQPRSRGGAG